ncbi:Uma2 family endonuclease [Chloracidobacterium thermophilum]|uniref:Uma2 family endonuclease n=1 Tax=Chloracidobacterium thermophilum TaxID=458033 RepID=UPI000738BE4C|nr:Uma2 family endonuclease [Chloracidobacterium thermophilum]
MSNLPHIRLTPDEYLAAERRATHKSEYVAGEVFAMSGATLRHSLIATNIAAELRQCLKGRDCTVHASDLRVRNAAGNHFYPDVVVVCGEPAYADDHRDTILNPILIVEVLSDSTQDYDRGGKFAQYRQLASLQEYLVVAQTAPHVEHHTRQADGCWLLHETSDLTAVLMLTSIGCQLPLAEMYDKVTFAVANPVEGATP